jgi:hypothetical protein
VKVIISDIFSKMVGYEHPRILKLKTFFNADLPIKDRKEGSRGASKQHGAGVLGDQCSKNKNDFSYEKPFKTQ